MGHNDGTGRWPAYVLTWGLQNKLETGEKHEKGREEGGGSRRRHEGRGRRIQTLAGEDGVDGMTDCSASSSVSDARAEGGE